MNDLSLIVPIYSVAGVFAIAVSFPSIVQLIKTKRSDELSLFSWVGWFVYQSIALVYSIYLLAYPLIFVNSLWISFYLVMIYLIIKYRRQPAAVPVRARKRK